MRGTAKEKAKDCLHYPVAHEFLDPVQIDPAWDEPGSERVTQGVENDFVAPVLVTFIESAFGHHTLICARGLTGFSTLG